MSPDSYKFRYIIKQWLLIYRFVELFPITIENSLFSPLFMVFMTILIYCIKYCMQVSLHDAVVSGMDQAVPFHCLFIQQNMHVT